MLKLLHTVLKNPQHNTYTIMSYHRVSNSSMFYALSTNCTIAYDWITSWITLVFNKADYRGKNYYMLIWLLIILLIFTLQLLQSKIKYCINSSRQNHPAKHIYIYVYDIITLLLGQTSKPCHITTLAPETILLHTTTATIQLVTFVL